MKTRTFVKLITLSLVGIMLLPMIASCDNGSNNSDITTTTAPPSGTTAPAETTTEAPEETTTPVETTTEKPAETTVPPETTTATPEETTVTDTPETTVSMKGKKVMFIGNSFIYYGACVVPGNQQETDTGWFYQICKANGEECTVYDYTYGGKDLAYIYAKYMKGNTYENFDYVIFSDSGDNHSDTWAVMQNVMKCFTGSPEIVYLNHSFTVIKNHKNLLSLLPIMQKKGVTIVDWGQLVYDVYNAKVTVPGTTQRYNKNSFIKNNGDSHHPNPLAGYITAQMCYCAITGKSAVGQMSDLYKIGNTLTYGKGEVGFDTFISTHYVKATDTSFKEVMNSEAEIKGLQQLMDEYIAKWYYGDKLNCAHTFDAGKVTTEATAFLPGTMTYTCSKCGETKTEEIPATGAARNNIASGCTARAYSPTKTSISSSLCIFLTDGSVGSNTTGKFDGAWATKGATDDYNGNKPASEEKVQLAMSDGTTSDYYYLVELDLGAEKTVNGFSLYLHGYKMPVMDKGFDILVSADGNTWKKVYSADAALLFSGTNDGKGYENYVDSTTATATDILPAYVSADFADVANVRYVAYGCTAYRDVNGYYTARLTEFEVYGK